MSEKKYKCIYCDKALVSIGNKRVNGANHIDWSSRKYHKKCWKIIILYAKVIDPATVAKPNVTHLVPSQ